MPLNSTSKTSPPAMVLMERCCRRPWEAYVEPIKMAPGVYYISGNDWVACYLIDTGDGLILIDTAMHETAYLMIENIRKLGYELTDIKKILLTHAHIDHIGAARTMKELTGAKLYLGERDLLFLHERRDLIRIGDYTCGEFEPDELYGDDKPITQGNITIHTVSTPGHTPGCTSMFFDVTDKDGRVLRCGIHGGVGLNLTKQNFEEDRLPATLRDEFIEGLKKLDQMEVDICLPSHTNQVGILLLKDQVTEDFNPYLDPSIWHELMQERLERVMQIVEDEKEG
ncbi:MBL fold metallo-hydrolase [Clostridium sp. MCC353]|uniref:MBL fold metallo-hydrolase n=1 Tax=Clostridium sp. MCC353 TaxID=2592646 RepID=UPI001C00A724|nr:MBL fold metallo-hydrolase [Clostridium sp. MCC353]MBT9778090.1 MBL fold metallo-hydrolase [Clostridium sp. MCC353]